MGFSFHIIVIYKTKLMSRLGTPFIFNVDLSTGCQVFWRAQAQDDNDNQADHEPGGNDGTSQVEWRSRSRDKLRKYWEDQHNKWYHWHYNMSHYVETLAVLTGVEERYSRTGCHIYYQDRNGYDRS